MMAEILRVLRWFGAQAWAMLEDDYYAMADILTRRAAEQWSATQIQAAIGEARREQQAATSGGVAILPIHGPLVPRANLLSDVSGMASPERIGAALQASLADDEVKAIIFDLDSPGGAVQGITELARTIFEARGTKPLIAQVHYTAASAAYWLATQADEIVMAPSAAVGSIGIFAEHFDESGADAAGGRKATLIAAGKYKTEGNPHEPLTEAARAAIQALVDAHYAVFTADVARGRGVTAETVRDGFGEGRMVLAKDAVAQGMADRIGTLAETVRRLRTPQGRSAAMRAVDQAVRLRAELTLLELTL